MTAAGASLSPDTYSKGGAIPDGEYIIKRAVTDMFDYNGTQTAQPALMILFADPVDAAVTYEQAYTAGKADRLIPSDDKKRFVHPRGEAAVIADGSNVALFVGAIRKAGFPNERLVSDEVTIFEGTRVVVTNVAQPKRAGLTDQKEGKTIPLVSKVVALPGAKAGAGRPTVVKATAAATAPATAQPAASSTANGDADATAIQAVMQALETAPDHTLKVKGLAVRCLKFAPGTKLNDLTKLITAEWLIAQADTTGWTTDGEVVAL